MRQNGNWCIFDKKSVIQKETRSDKIVFLRIAVCNKFRCIFSANWPFAPNLERLKAPSAVPNNL